jgi:hypothetical protein
MIFGSRLKTQTQLHTYTHPAAPWLSFYYNKYWDDHPYYVWDDETARVYGTTMLRATQAMLDNERKSTRTIKPKPLNDGPGKS